MAKVKTPRWGWALTGSGHFFKECLDLIGGLEHVDLFVTGVRENTLYRNRGDGTFENVTAKAGLSERGKWAVAAGWFDYDNDGLLDLFVVRYVGWNPATELFCGFQRSRERGPTHYPVACSPQAWASATPFTLIEASLGLQFDPVANQIRLLNPRLPSFLDELVLRNLQLKQSSVDLKVRRHANEVSVEILERRGRIQVAVVFGRTADPTKRLIEDV